ncbi:MAG: hypothetical protein LBU36_05140 [Clostridiales bacterium]|jgi:sporulation integral membrane protein YlbJ|nr:hypothetical protein [Clostridiales bacterium]
MSAEKISNFFLPLFMALFCAFLLLNPREVSEAALSGAALWKDAVFPSLFPFLVGANLMLQLDFARRAGFLRLLCRALFGLPESGALGVFCGFTSGYPVGAKVAADLYRERLLTRRQAERLMACANNSGAAFVTGALGAGMFGSPAAGWFILFIHYLGAVLLGLLLRAMDNEPPSPPRTPPGSRKKQPPFAQAFTYSVKNAVETILQIGGFLVLFSVAVKILRLAGAFRAMPPFAAAIATGLVEVTSGCAALSAGGANKPAIIAAAALVSFGGLSVCAQSANFLRDTDLSLGRYVFRKALHAVITALLGLLLEPLWAGARRL